VAAEFMKGILKFDQMIARETSRTIVEGEVYLSESKPDVAKILDLKVTVNIKSKEVIQDRVMVEGTVRHNIIYLAETSEQHVNVAEFDSAFVHYIDTPGSKPKMSLALKHNVDHIDFELLNHRRITTKTVLNLDVCVTQLIQSEVIKDLRGIIDVQLLKEKIRTTAKSAQANTRVIVREDLRLPDDLPSIRNILRQDATVFISDIKVLDNKVTVNGVIKLQIIYNCNELNYPIRYIEKDCQLNHTLEISGAYQGMECTIEPVVQEVIASAIEDITGDLRIMDVETVLSMDVQLFESDMEELITDVYCPNLKLDLKSEKIRFSNVEGTSKTQISFKENIDAIENNLRPAGVLYTHIKPVLTECKVSEGKVMLDGILIANVICRSDDSNTVIYNVIHEIPFRDSIDILGVSEDMSCQVNLDVKNTKTILLSRDRIDLRTDLNVEAIVSKQVEIDLLTDIKVLEERNVQPGLFIYFVRKGDTLWSVGKKYDVKITDILSLNELEDKVQLMQGEKLIIYKRLDEPPVSAAKF